MLQSTLLPPTGTISIIAGCCSGIEPLFAISFVRNVLSGMKLFEINPLFEDIAKKKGFYSKEVMVKIAQYGSLRNLKEIPEEVKRAFVTAFDVEPRQYLSIQATFQKHTDNSASKTINLPADATADDVRRIYLMAYELKRKGITVYRYGSKKEQVLTFDYKAEGRPEIKDNLITAESEYSGGCASRTCSF